MSYIHENIIYEELIGIDPLLLKPIEENLPLPSELRVYKTEDQIRSENIYASKISKRNNVGSYIIPIEYESILVNFIPVKQFITDLSISYALDNSFKYFVAPSFSDSLPEPITLEEGAIFRVTGEGVLPKEQYTYYTIENGIVKKIPNFKTVEVMLFERNKLIDEVRVIEPTEFDDLLRTSMINKFVQDGLTLEEANEEVAKFILTG